MKIKKNMIIIVAAVVLVVAGALYFLNTTTDSVSSWIEDWLPDGLETAEGLSGQWIIEPYYIMSDGSSIPIRSPTKESGLRVEYEGVHVESILYSLSCQATRSDATADNFQSVEIDFSDLQIDALFTKGGFFNDVWKDSFITTRTIDFPSGATQTPVTQVAWLNIPIDIDGSVNQLGSPLSQLPCNTLTEMTDGWDTGTWTVTYTPLGDVQFRGLNSQSGHSDWYDTTLPEEITHTIIIEPDYEISVDWTSEVTYGACNPNYDVSGDGQVNYVDALTINNHITSGAPYNAAYDMNCDGIINEIDYMIVTNNFD